MDKTLEKSDQNETKVLLFVDKTSDDESTIQNDLNFPWSLINVIKELKKAYPSKLQLIKHVLLLYPLQLFIVFIIFFICLVVGGTIDPQSDRNYMLRTVFIVQGKSGLLTVSLHVCTHLLRSSTLPMTALPFNQRHLIRFCIISSHLLTVFCIIWFFIGHIWFIQVFSEFRYNSYSESMFTVLMVITQYIVGFWLLCCSIRNNSEHFSRQKKKMSPDLLDEIKCLERKETTLCEQTVEKKN